MKFTVFFNNSEQIMAALDILPKDDSPLGNLRRAIHTHVLVAVDEAIANEKRAQFDKVRERVMATASVVFEDSELHLKPKT